MSLAESGTNSTNGVGHDDRETEPLCFAPFPIATRVSKKTRSRLSTLGSADAKG